MVGEGIDHEDGVEPLPANVSPSGFGRYHVFASLGRGGMADVFLAVARGPMGFNKLAVIKRLRPTLVREPGFRDMFLDEARLAARLNHPNVIQSYEVGESHGSFYIAMEYLEGQPLNKIIAAAIARGEAFEPVFCARVIADACNGLNHAHELRDYDGTPLQIIHRDVSPHNVFVTYDGQVKLVDFGIAKAALSSTQTEVGVLKGKVAYMAPEQAMGGAIDARADLFAMGIVLWEMMARKRLMQGENAANTLHRLMNEPVQSIAVAVPGIDPRIAAIVMRALERDPQRRFATAREMRDALEGYIHESGHALRQEDVGKRVAGMFAAVREQVQRQVQRQMQAMTGSAPLSSPGSVRGLSLASLDRIDQDGGDASAQLLDLGDSATGLAGLAAGTDPRSSSTVVPVTKPKRRRALWLAVPIVLFAVGVVAVLVIPRGRGAGDDAAHERAGAGAAAVVYAATGIASAASGAASPQPVAAAPVDVRVGADVRDGAAAREGHAIAEGAVPATRGVPRPAPSHPAAARTPARAVNDDAPGYLTLDTYPWTKVTEGARALGTTPVVHLALPAGTHVLTLENPELGIKQSYTITLKRGESVSRRLGLK